MVALKANALGDYLRARRDQVCPEDVGLLPGGRRRATGLRREELAMSAGISAEYYLRLERGRAKNPSPQIIDALARALQLDIKAAEYLRQLASPTVGRSDHPDPGTVAEAADELIYQMPMPALVANKYLDVLAANPMARALSPGFEPGRNLLCWRLFDPAARDLYVDWEEATEVAVSGLREAAGSDLSDPRLQSLIQELSSGSERFGELWARADVGFPPRVFQMRHPEVGELHLHPHRFIIPHSGGQQLVTYRADPGSDSARALDVLRALH
jgi:transcriptional regulator with XRE-family HTH domain